MREVKRIELNDKHIKLRIIILIALILSAIVAFSFFFINLFSKKSGLETIHVSSSYGDTICDNDYVFNYYLGKGENSPTEDYKIVVESYSKHLNYAYKSLSKYDEYADYNNLYYLNRHPNEKIKVSSFLYDSLKKIYDYDQYLLYLGPINSFYDTYNRSGNDGSNPKSESVKNIINEIINYYKNDVSIDFYDDFNIKLNVSNNYLNKLNELSIVDIIDFSYFKNAFILDYISLKLKQDNLTYGYISSNDGYYVNLDDTFDYKYFVFDNINGKLRSICNTVLKGNYNIVNYSNLTKLLSLYINPDDGMNYDSVKSLTSYSKTLSLVDIVLQTNDIYIKNVFKEDNIKINSIWLIDKTVYYNDSDLSIYDIYQTDDVKYNVERRDLNND